VLCIDGIHTGYVNDKPGPQESQIDTDNLQIWLQIGRDAIAGNKRLIITHSKSSPGRSRAPRKRRITPAGVGAEIHPVVKWGPMKTQTLSEVKRGRLLVIGFAGNSAPDHVDELHSLPEYLR